MKIKRHQTKEQIIALADSARAHFTCKYKDMNKEQKEAKHICMETMLALDEVIACAKEHLKEK